MKNKIYGALLIAFCSLLLICCSKSDKYKPSAVIADYTNLAVGKFVIYKLDSTVVLPYGLGLTVHSYTVKDSVEGIVTDNLNRPGYRVVRYQWDTAAQRWNNSNTFFALQTATSFEYTENNLKQTRMINPIGALNWQGNSSIAASPFNFSNNDQSYLTWSFSYSNIGQPFQAGTQHFDTTVTVVQYDSANNKPFSQNQPNSYSKSYEVYAKGVGKVFQDLLSWEYETSYLTDSCKLIHCAGNKCDTTFINCQNDQNPGGVNCDSIANAQIGQGVRIVCDTVPGVFTYNGYGVRLSIINHN